MSMEAMRVVSERRRDAVGSMGGRSVGLVLRLRGGVCYWCLFDELGEEDATCLRRMVAGTE